MMTSPLIQAILDGEIDAVRNLIENHPEMLEIRSEIGTLPYKIAVNKGLANQQTALLRAQAPGSENFEDYSGLLIHYLGDISEDCVCAGWLIDIEFIVWKIAFTNEPLSDDTFRFNEIDEEAKADLRFLSRKVKGWAVWRDEDKEPIIVPFDEWNKIWENYRAGKE